MKTRFVPITTLVSPLKLLLIVGAWASLSIARADELTQAQQAIDRATHADADQYSPSLITQARQRFQQAQQASLDRHQRKQAPVLALQAAADADLATAQSQHAVILAQINQAKNDLNQLQRERDAAKAAPPVAPAQANEPTVNSASFSEAPTP